MHILLTLSFRWFWREISEFSYYYENYFTTPEFFSALIFTLAAVTLFVYRHKKGFHNFNPAISIFILFIFIFILGKQFPTTSVVLINFLILFNGIFTIWQGSKLNHLGILNYGLLTITALIICRFFDSNMSFVIRGLLFVIVGAGFFIANYLMIKKRRQNNLN